MRRVVLVTRPEPGLSETMRAVAALGFEPLAAPLLRIEPLSPTIPKRVQAVLLTSGQAVAPLAALAPWFLDTPVLAVGDATARRARAGGFTAVSSANGDAADLAAMVRGRLDPATGPLLLACGRSQGRQLAQALRSESFRVIRRCLYSARTVEGLGTDVLLKLERDEVEAILFFSAETARSFGCLLPARLHGALSGVRALVIGTLAAGCIDAFGWKGITTAERPTAASMLLLLAATLNREDDQPG